MKRAMLSLNIEGAKITVAVASDMPLLKNMTVNKRHEGPGAEELRPIYWKVEGRP